MKQFRVKIAAVATLAALGVLTAVALASNGSEPQATSSQETGQVRTEVVDTVTTEDRGGAPSQSTGSSGSGNGAPLTATRPSSVSPSGSSMRSGEDEHRRGRGRGRGGDDAVEHEVQHGGEIENEHGHEVEDEVEDEDGDHRGRGGSD